LVINNNHLKTGKETVAEKVLNVKELKKFNTKQYESKRADFKDFPIHIY